MTAKPTPLQARILAALRAGEIEDRALYAALHPTPIGTVSNALLKLREAGCVVATHAGTRLRLA